MNNTAEISIARITEQYVQWTKYPPQTCFVCRVALQREDDGGFSVYAMNLPGVVSQGETEEEALANIVEALSGALAEYKSYRNEIPWEDTFIEDGVIERRLLVNLNETAVAG